MAIVHLEKLSLVDYDEYLTATIFTNGCNFRCPFCHNGALVTSLNQKEIPFEEILEFLKTRINKLDAVTISGGEPTLHKDLVNQIKEIKKLGFKIKLDTNGSNPKILKELIENNLIDYVAMDIKNKLDKYNLTTGVSNLNINPIIESINLIMSSQIEYEFRTTIIDEFHNKEDIVEIAKMIKGAKKYRLQKYVDRDGCIVSGFHEIEKSVALDIADTVKEYINDVELRGY